MLKDTEALRETGRPFDPGRSVSSPEALAYRAAHRMWLRIEHLVAELHRRAARFLVRRFDVILLSTFETSEMVERGRRRIRSQTVRRL